MARFPPRDQCLQLQIDFDNVSAKQADKSIQITLQPQISQPFYMLPTTQFLFSAELHVLACKKPRRHAGYLYRTVYGKPPWDASGPSIANYCKEGVQDSQTLDVFT